MKRKRSGFTLIELLVVIAIIAILASILLPVFATARERARGASCQNNLKQLGTAIIAYNQDYDERMPMWDVKNAGVDYPWDVQIYSYIKAKGVYKCPDDSGPDPARSYAASFGNMSGGSSTADSAAAFDARSPMGQNLAAIVAPATSILLAENYRLNGKAPADAMGVSTYSVLANNVTYPTVATSATVSFVNSGHTKTNFLFCEGHVKAYNAAQTASDATAGVKTVSSGLGFWDIEQQ